ncbi:MAG: 50S ribosomal protein L24 [Candidatus Pacebacteria bacterium]|nr:50S ribosomal protein L24 [Candidatus Paceibacterota bacterium]
MAKIKKGDNVIVISGASKGKKGTVLKVMPETGRALVEGINLKKKHEKKRSEGGQGQVVEVSRSVNMSNLAHLDPKGGKQTRVGSKIVGNKKIRVATKSGQEIK